MDFLKGFNFLEKHAFYEKGIFISQWDPDRLTAKVTKAKANTGIVIWYYHEIAAF